MRRSSRERGQRIWWLLCLRPAAVFVATLIGCDGLAAYLYSIK